MTLSLAATTETHPLAPLSRSDLAGAAWGACQICLVADRVASLRTGSTHKVYRGWRIEVGMHHGRPGPGMTLFTIPIDPTELTASRTKYALVQWGNQGDILVGQASAFSWSTTSIGTADPFATALDEARRDLGAAGWSEDGAVPMCYVKSDPAPPGGKTVALPGSDAGGHDIALPGAQNLDLQNWTTSSAPRPRRKQLLDSMNGRRMGAPAQRDPLSERPSRIIMADAHQPTSDLRYQGSNSSLEKE